MIVPMPIIGNVAEYLMAISVAIKNKLELSMEIVFFKSANCPICCAGGCVYESTNGNPIESCFQ
jgi:hypothetical protein